MAGCNSCKHMDLKNTRPGRTSGYLYYCNLNKTYVNAAKDQCDAYEEDHSKTSYERNESYNQSKVFNDAVVTHGCDSCKFLDPEKKGAGEAGGYIYYCSKKDTYVNAAKDNCELWEDGHRTTHEKNELYRNSKQYSNDKNDQFGKNVILLIIILVVGILLTIFMR